MAALYRLPCVFLCENNHYAEFTPQGKHQAISDVADRAVGWGMPGVVVDGMDAIAVYEAVNQAVANARAGAGPTLIEAKTYRFYDHVGVKGMRIPYRTEEEVEEWKERDPIKIYRERLKQFGVGDKVIAGIDAEVRKEVDDATEACKAAPMPPLDILTTDVYADGGWAWRN